MILGFKKKFPWGQSTGFVDKILACVYPSSSYHPKRHTIRLGQRFKGGELLHMATGVRSKHYIQFNKGIYALYRCKSVQRIDISFRSERCIAIYIDKKLKFCKNKEHVFGLEWFYEFVKNDGFNNVEQFFKWFDKPIRNAQIIHWTDLKY